MFERLDLYNVRAHKNFSTQLDKKTNIIIGPNASGKTTIIEALHILASGRSFKGPLKNIINSSEQWAKIVHETNTTSSEIKIQTKEDKTTKEFTVNSRTTKLLPKNKHTPVSLFEPGQLRVISGSPERRREFFDSVLSQIDPGYSKQKNTYIKALRQRNTLLKQPTINHEHMFVWDMKLAEIGQYIHKQRRKLTKDINARINKQYKEIAGKKAEIALRYDSDFVGLGQEAALNQYNKLFTKDHTKGFTGFGVHRDNLVLLINKREAASSASRGETRTIMLCLKLIEIELIEEARGDKPVLLFDDVFGELDGRRRTLLTEVVSGHQTIITTTDADIVTKDFLGKSKIIPTRTN